MAGLDTGDITPLCVVGCRNWYASAPIDCEAQVDPWLSYKFLEVIIVEAFS